MMRKRDKQAKKWLKRFVYSVVADLPRTAYRTHLHDEHGCDVPDDGSLVEGYVTVIGRNHTVINGEVVGEGVMYRHGKNKLITNMRSTGAKLAEITGKYQYPHLRNVAVHRNTVRVRIITE